MRIKHLISGSKNEYINLYQHFINIDLYEFTSKYYINNLNQDELKLINNKYAYPENLNFSSKNLFTFENTNIVEEQEIIDLNNYIIEESESEDSSHFNNDYESANDNEKKLIKILKKLTKF